MIIRYGELLRSEMHSLPNIESRGSILCMASEVSPVVWLRF
jgi:hypothetical protein